MSFPHTRLRRRRRTPALRDLLSETTLHPAQLIQPLFVVEDPGAAGPIASMPGVSRYAMAELTGVLDALCTHGVQAVLLFGIPARKDDLGSSASGARDVIPETIRWLRARYPELLILADVCLCEYTAHGHCGIVRDGIVDNDATLPHLARAAVAYARAGADLVAPSGMLDGMVAALRSALDHAGFHHVGILSYTAKYASAFYGPFRDAADCAPHFGDRRTHQMDPANAAEALAEAALDIAEGADLLMVKPAVPYLDVVRRLTEAHPDVPVVAYHVSGEYAMLKAAAANGWIDERAVVLETLTAIRRAGARAIITYYAATAAEWMRS